jgi:hypothetical protein
VARNKSVRLFEDLFSRLPAAKITQIKEFTPAAWVKAKVTEKIVAQVA